MGFGDKLKGLKDQAQQAVAENKDKIQGAVQVVGETANTKTHGKYAAKIMKVGDKVESSVDKFAGGSDEAAQDAAPGAAHDVSTDAPDPAFNIEDGAPEEDASEAPIVHEPANPVTPSAAEAAASGFPEFE